jgi:peptide/nickel transport system permease protein
MAQEAAVPLGLEQEEAPPARSRWRRLASLARRHPLGVFGLLCVSALLFCGIFADLIAPYDPVTPVRGTTSLGALAEPVDAGDTELLVRGMEGGTGSTAYLGDEKIIVLFVEEQPDGLSKALVERGADDTQAVDHPAGAVLQREDDIQKLQPPSLKYPFGTDNLGRDVLSRTIFGARISLMIGLVSIGVGVTAGTFFGVLSGYLGGIVDSIIQRIVDMLLAFPAVVLLLAIVAVIGDEDSTVRVFLRDNTPIPEGEFLGVPVFLDIFVVSLGIGLAVAVGTTRIVRGAVLSVKENVYIEAARAMGASDRRIMMHHIFPNVAALVVVLASVFLPIAILAEAAISFLGVGVPEPTPSWGADLSGVNQRNALSGYWWPVFFPGLALSLVVLGFNMLGDAFRDISDPRLRGSGLGGPRGGGL